MTAIRTPDQRLRIFRGFRSSDDLIANDLALLLSERFDIATQPAEAAQPSTPLPAATSRFIGREREKSIVRDLLTGGEARLVTLLGAGSIGKTRLALEVGAALKEHARAAGSDVNLDH